MTTKKWVYLFDEVEQAEAYAGSWDGVRGLLGGKGSNLAEMVRIGVPVPWIYHYHRSLQCLSGNE